MDEPVVAYLAPELPALSATFVYEELLGLERRGMQIIPISVRRPALPASGQEALSARTLVLYGDGPATVVWGGLAALPMFGRRSAKALRWLVKDMTSLGLWRRGTWKLAFQWLAGARLARWLQNQNCQHLHVHFAHVPAQIAMYASAFADIPFTIMAHANDIFERGALLPQKAMRATQLLTISHFNVAYLQTVGVPESRLSVVRCGVSFARRPQAPCFDRKPIYRIGTLGRLIEKKGVDDLLHALANLRSPTWRVELSVAGDGPLRAALEAQVRVLGVADRVRFEGALSHSAVTTWLHSLDIFALACKADSNGDMDGIPVALMEAMSQQVPVVSTRLSGIPELIIDGKTGLLARPADPVDLERAVRELLDDPDLRATLADAAMHHVETEFGQNLNLDRLLAHFPAGGLTPPQTYTSAG